MISRYRQPYTIIINDIAVAVWKRWKFYLRSLFFSLVTIGAFVLIAGMSIFLMGCSGLMYYPTKEIYFTPEKFHLTKEDVYFQDEDGRRLHGWWIAATSATTTTTATAKDSSEGPVKNLSVEKSKGTIVHFHGNAENLTSHFMQLSWMPERGYNYFIFDYPGYGQSEGSPSPKDCVQAGVAAMKWVHANKDTRPLVIVGQSMGGIVALRTVEELHGEVPLKGFVAESTFPSFQKIARKKLSSSMVTWLFQPLAYVVLSDKWAPQNIAKAVRVPVLVTHGQKDMVVEPEFGEMIYEQSNEPKSIWRIPEGHHTDIFWAHNRIYRQRFLDWLASLP
jgi:fermentation-respiration switch protein FrsA (DUF1100 family)